MAKKLKDLLKVFNDQISSNELSAILSASSLDDVEIEDENFDQIKGQIEGLLTVESAVTNPEVKRELYQKHEKRIKLNLEDKFKVLAESMDVGDEYENHKTIEEKIDFLNSNIDKVKAPVEDAELKKKVDAYKADIANLNKQLSEVNEAKEAEINELKTGFERTNIKNSFINTVSNKYKLAEAYQKDRIRNNLYEDIFSEISDKATLKLVDGKLGVFDKEDPEKPLYIKNKEAKLDDLVNPLMQDYIRVSDPKPEPPNPGRKPNNEPTFEPGTIAERFARQKQAYANG